MQSRVICSVINFIYAPKIMAYPILGVYFDDKSLSYLYCKHVRYGFFPEKYGKKDINIQNQDPDKIDIAYKLKQIKKETKIQNAAFVLPENQSIVLVFPKNNNNPTKDEVEYLITSQTDININEIVYMYKTTNTQTVVYAYNKSYIQSFQDVAKIAGINLIEIYPVQDVLSKALSEKKYLNFILHFEKDYVIFALADNDVNIFATTIKFDIQDAIEKLSKAKRPTKAYIKDLFAPVFAEINRQLEFWGERITDSGELIYPHKSIILSGIVDEKIIDIFRVNFSIKTQIKNPWSKILNTNKYLPKISMKDALMYAPLAGIYAYKMK